MVQEVLYVLSFIIVIAAILTVIFRFVKQPPIIAYLISGILVGPLFFNILNGTQIELIQLLAHLGVAFLLFIVGLSLDLKVLKEVGKVSIFAGIMEVALTSSFVFLIAYALGFSNTAALYLAAGLAFSSTVVVVKILSDKREIDTLHGRIALGILIMEDFIAAILLMAIPIIKDQTSYLIILREISLAILLVISIFVIAYISSKFLNYLAGHHETLFLFGIAWALIIAVIFDKLGFSLEIGALIAGMSLASSKYNLELGGKIKPLRDFFVILFFVFFGSQLSGDITWAMVKNALIFSTFIIIGKPIIVMTVLKLFGYKRRTNFFSGISLAQISEFSLILILMGYNLGLIEKSVLSLVVIVALITIGLSGYSIHNSTFIFNKISKMLKIFEDEDYLEKGKKESFDIFLFGYHRIGYKLLDTLKRMNMKFVVVDYNPKVILDLSKQRVNAIYGDASDEEFLSEINIQNAKLIISTIPNEEINIVLEEKLKQLNPDATFIATTEKPREALTLYNKGVDYVLVPHHLGGEYASQMIEKFKFNKEKYQEEGKKHIKDLHKARNNSNFNS